jgi:pimeloyl-ACP methyl ester carboxylesterase
MSIRALGALAIAIALVLPHAASAASALDTAPSRFATVDGIRVHYKSIGRGDRAVVFVHGWTCDLTFWRDQVEWFASRSRVVLVDLPGHGQSDKPMVDYTQDLFARGVHAALADAGVKQAMLVGHSMGTPVIRQFYRLYPAETAALVAVDGGLNDPLPDPAAQKARIELLNGSAFAGEIDKSIEGMFVPTTSPEIRQFVKSRMTAAPNYVSVGAIKGLFVPGLWKDDPIKVPMLAIMANRGNPAADRAAQFRRLAPQVEYHEMNGVGHFLMMEKPAEFNELVTRFLSAHRLLG